jgi:hypothetical protein
MTMTHKRENHEVCLEAFHTQESVTIGPRKVIIVSMPKKLIVELEDEDTCFNKVALHDLVAVVIMSVTTGTTLDSMELIMLQ